MGVVSSIAVDAIFRTGLFEVERKGDKTLLTEADLLANHICHKGLSPLIPDGGWLSEESIDDVERLSREQVWIVDPIDGTYEFVHGVPEYSVSIGLAERGRAVLGVIAIPAANEIVIGCVGEGVSVVSYDPATVESVMKRIDFASGREDAYLRFLAEPSLLESVGLKQKDAALSLHAELKTARILVSQSEWRKGKFDRIKEDLTIQPSGSIARKLALLAAGVGDLVVSLNPKNDWDICGGTALVEAAGGIVVDLARNERRLYNTANTLSEGLVAGNEGLVNQFLHYYKNISLE